jgi:hypothetical protein
VPETKVTSEIVSLITVAVAVRGVVFPIKTSAVAGARLTVHDRTVTIDVPVDVVVPSSIVAVAVIVEVPPETPVTMVV